MEGVLEKLSSSRNASLELEGIIVRLDLLQNIFLQVVDEFGDVSRSIDCINFTIKKVTLALEELKLELTKREAHMIVLGDAHVDIEQDDAQVVARKQNWSGSNRFYHAWFILVLTRSMVTIRIYPRGARKVCVVRNYCSCRLGAWADLKIDPYF